MSPLSTHVVSKVSSANQSQNNKPPNSKAREIPSETKRRARKETSRLPAARKRLPAESDLSVIDLPKLHSPGPKQKRSPRWSKPRQLARSPFHRAQRETAAAAQRPTERALARCPYTSATPTRWRIPIYSEQRVLSASRPQQPSSGRSQKGAGLLCVCTRGGKGKFSRPCDWYSSGDGILRLRSCGILGNWLRTDEVRASCWRKVIWRFDVIWSFECVRELRLCMTDSIKSWICNQSCFLCYPLELSENILQVLYTENSIFQVPFLFVSITAITENTNVNSPTISTDKWQILSHFCQFHLKTRILKKICKCSPDARYQIDIRRNLL